MISYCLNVKLLPEVLTQTFIINLSLEETNTTVCVLRCRSFFGDPCFQFCFILCVRRWTQLSSIVITFESVWISFWNVQSNKFLSASQEPIMNMYIFYTENLKIIHHDFVTYVKNSLLLILNICGVANQIFFYGNFKV